MRVEYIEHSGSDLTVVNAARVSLDKHHAEFQENDIGLINFLARNNHWTPFGHPHITVRITVPIFVANQLKRHVVGFVLNEVSRRYIDSEPEFYDPEALGARAKNKKQGAKEGEFVENKEAFEIVDKVYNLCRSSYSELLKLGVAPEDARMILPLATYTSWYWTGSLYAYSRLYNLRIKEDTQRQTREVAKMLGDIIAPLFPISWKNLVNLT